MHSTYFVSVWLICSHEKHELGKPHIQNNSSALEGAKYTLNVFKVALFPGLHYICKTVGGRGLGMIDDAMRL